MPQQLAAASLKSPDLAAEHNNRDGCRPKMQGAELMSGGGAGAPRERQSGPAWGRGGEDQEEVAREPTLGADSPSGIQTGF